MAQESKALEDKLGMLKDQLSDLRTSIKVKPLICLSREIYTYLCVTFH
jgi:hypothetical protein